MIALYPGRFDPMTNGHLDIVRRAARLFESLIIAVYENPEKPALFSASERLSMVKEAVDTMANVEAVSYSGLTVALARRLGAGVLVRGLRVSDDFEGEMDMAMMNRRLAPDIDLVCLMASPECQYISGSLLREVARLGGGIDDLVPANVAPALKKKFSKS